ncbi:MAG: RNase P subunit p30 family protein [Candidatus Nanoarchaeia archaeon]|jgi:RNase P/RNase MRP subunit p30
MTSDIVLFEGDKHNFGFDLIINANARGSIRIAEGNEETMRQLVESKRADIIAITERIPKDSLHFRRTAIDSVICELARKKGIVLAFSFSSILNSRDRALVMGRMMQSIRLCRKHKVKMAFASFARDKWEMRAPEELKAFARVLGMTPSEAESAVNAVEWVAEDRKRVNGVRILE